MKRIVENCDNTILYYSYQFIFNAVYQKTADIASITIYTSNNFEESCCSWYLHKYAQVEKSTKNGEGIYLKLIC